MPNTRFPGYNINRGSRVSDTSVNLNYTATCGRDDPVYVSEEATRMFERLVGQGYNATVDQPRTFPYVGSNHPVKINVLTSASLPDFTSGSVTLRAKKGLVKGGAHIQANTATPAALDHFLAAVFR